VEMRLLYDSAGVFVAGGGYIRYLLLTYKGGQLREYNPVNPLCDARLWRTNQRNHRKMLGVDG